MKSIFDYNKAQSTRIADYLRSNMNSLSATARELGITELSSLRANIHDDYRNRNGIQSNNLYGTIASLHSSTSTSEPNSISGDNNNLKNKNVTVNNKKPKRAVTSKRGRGGDPRMHRAVQARLANPKMSLLDALKAGGFEFNELDATGNKVGNPEALDNDNVQLAQRKNQLSRRIRHARQAMMRGKKKNDNDDDADVSEQDGSADDESFTSNNIKKTKKNVKDTKSKGQKQRKNTKKNGNASDSNAESKSFCSSSNSFNNTHRTATDDTNIINKLSMSTTSQSQSIAVNGFMSQQMAQNIENSSLNSVLSQQQSLAQAYLVAQAKLQEQHHNHLMAAHQAQLTRTLPTTFQSSGGLNLSFFKTMAQSTSTAQLAADVPNQEGQVSKAKPPKKRGRKKGDDGSLSHSVLTASTNSTIKTQPICNRDNNVNDDDTIDSLHSFLSNHSGRNADNLQEPNMPSSKLDNDDATLDFTPDSTGSFSNFSSNHLQQALAEKHANNKRKFENDNVAPEFVNSISMVSSKPKENSLITTPNTNNDGNDDATLDSISSFMRASANRARNKANSQFGSAIPTERSSSKDKSDIDDITPDSISSFDRASANFRARQAERSQQEADNLSQKEGFTNKNKSDGMYDSLFSNLSARDSDEENEPPMLPTVEQPPEKPGLSKRFGSDTSLERLLETNEDDESDEDNISRGSKPFKKRWMKIPSTDSLEELLSTSQPPDFDAQPQRQLNLQQPPEFDAQQLQRFQSLQPQGHDSLLINNELSLRGKNASATASHRPQSSEPYPQNAFPLSHDPRMQQALENYKKESDVLYKRSLLRAGYLPSEVGDEAKAFNIFAAKVLADDLHTWDTLRNFFKEYFVMSNDGKKCYLANLKDMRHINALSDSEHKLSNQINDIDDDDDHDDDDDDDDDDDKVNSQDTHLVSNISSRRKLKVFDIAANKLTSSIAEQKVSNQINNLDVDDDDDNDDQSSQDTDLVSNMSSCRKHKVFDKATKKLSSSDDESDASSTMNASHENETVDTDFTKQLIELESVGECDKSQMISALGSKSNLSQLQKESFTMAASAISRHVSDYSVAGAETDANAVEEATKEEKKETTEQETIEDKSLSSESTEVKSEDTNFSSALKSSSSDDHTAGTEDQDQSSTTDEFGDNFLSGILDLC